MSQDIDAASKLTHQHLKAMKVRGKSNTFAGNILKLAGGSVFAQGIGMIIAPIITRLFAPEAFGAAALFASITGIIGVISCFRYELAIMLPKTDETAVNLLAGSLLIVVGVSVLSGLIVLFAANGIAGLLNAPALEPYLWLIPIAVFFNGVFLAFNYWYSRTQQFGHLSMARIISAVSGQGTKLGGGLAGAVSGGVLILGSILGQCISAIVLGSQLWRNHSSLLRKDIRWNSMSSAFKRYKKFPIYGTWSALLNTTSQQLPTLILAFYFSPEIVGFYALGRMVLGMPSSLVGAAVGQVFFQKASVAHKSHGNLTEVVEEIFKRLVSLGVFPFLLLTVIGKDVFIVVFGNEWAEAGIYMQILSPLTFFQFISSPLSNITNVLEKQQFGTLMSLCLFISRTISLAIGGYFGNVYLALMLFSASGIILYFLVLIVQFSWIGITFHTVFSIMFYRFTVSIIWIVPTFITIIVTDNIAIVLLMSAFLSIMFALYILNQNGIFAMESFRIIRESFR